MEVTALPSLLCSITSLPFFPLPFLPGSLCPELFVICQLQLFSTSTFLYIHSPFLSLPPSLPPHSTSALTLHFFFLKSTILVKHCLCPSDRVVNYVPIRAVGWGPCPCTGPISGTSPCTPCRGPRTPFSHRQSGTGTQPTRPRHP